MEYFTPVHQFEIRFSKLLNFAQKAQDVLSPFVPLAKDIQVEQELSIKAKYTIIYDNYYLIIQNDRLIIRFEGEVGFLVESGSIIQDPFLSIYKRICDLSTFGELKEVILFTIYVKSNPQDEGEGANSKLSSDFMQKYLKIDEVQQIMNKLDDVALTIESSSENEKVNLNFGPYLGIADVNKFNFLIFTQEMLDRCRTVGQMCAITVNQIKPKDLNFNSYKALYKTSFGYIHKLWQ